jgi:transcription elongation factor Elf1
MGKKRRGKKLTVQKFVYKIPKQFSCPACMKPASVKVTFSKKPEEHAEILCTSCGVGEANIPIGPLTEPIDIYDDWMDTWREANARFNAVRRTEPDEERLEHFRPSRRHEEIEYDDTGQLRRVTARQESSGSSSSLESADLESSD